MRLNDGPAILYFRVFPVEVRSGERVILFEVIRQDMETGQGDMELAGIQVSCLSVEDAQSAANLPGLIPVVDLFVTGTVFYVTQGPPKTPVTITEKVAAIQRLNQIAMFPVRLLPGSML